jgi:predicted RecA/RadA family phage recombinase
MPAVFVQEGASIDYTPTVDVAVGAVVVQGELVGVASRAIPANTTGALAVAGVFDFPRAAGGTYAAGSNVYWDAAAQNATTTVASNKLMGKSVRISNAGEATVRVRLSQ